MLGRRSLIAVLTAFAIVASTAVACLVIVRGEQEHERLEQRRVTELALRRVKEVIQGPLDGLASVRAFFQSSSVVTKGEFAHFARHLFAHPALDAVSFVQEVPQSGRRAWERRHGVRIRQVVAGGSLRPARRRAVYDPITYALFGGGPPRGSALTLVPSRPAAQRCSPRRRQGAHRPPRL
jgi:CHASE1-domain containing sensor protein